MYHVRTKEVYVVISCILSHQHWMIPTCWCFSCYVLQASLCIYYSYCYCYWTLGSRNTVVNKNTAPDSWSTVSGKGYKSIHYQMQNCRCDSITQRKTTLLRGTKRADLEEKTPGSRPEDQRVLALQPSKHNSPECKTVGKRQWEPRVRQGLHRSLVSQITQVFACDQWE